MAKTDHSDAKKPKTPQSRATRFQKPTPLWLRPDRHGEGFFEQHERDPNDIQSKYSGSSRNDPITYK